MAGAGVGVGMLRARRRDVSVKPNRKLDRKSSRGMIYENEELRLRTININAEVEQGQNDIKKLRRENEQLRREIWSLRDEYDKLEEILKRQKSREESEEYEDRSDEDDDLRSEYSYEEDEEPDQGDQESIKELSKSEQLENAENQKISTEKMTSNSVHRLHVDFDDLSVVDEEEEPKRDKEKKEFSSEDNQQTKESRSPLSILKSTRQLHENIPFYPAAYQTPTSLTSPTYYTECPFKFPNTTNLMLPSEASGMVTSSCPRLNANSLVPIPRLTGPNMDSVSDQILHAPPAGWQSNILIPQEQSDTFIPSDVDSSIGIQSYGGIQHDQTKLQTFGSMTAGLSTLPSFLPKRNIGLKLSTNPFNSTGFANAHLNTEKAVVENGWSVNGNSMNVKGTKEPSSNDVSKKETKESPVLSVTEKPKHFFAPLPSKLKKSAEEPSPTISHFGTGNSSSSGKTGSTVVSKNQYTTQKGSADVYVNGAVPCEDSFHKGVSEQQRTYLSTDNLLITGDKCTPGNQLTKSMSCQDLHRDSQSASISHADGRQQMMTKSDNTLDNISDTKPYKSHLSVTLRTPRVKQAVSPDTPEIPELPSIDYRLFKNPFLRTFDPPSNYMDQNNVTRPLSVQVNDENPCYYTSQPEVSGFNRGASFGDRYRSNHSDQNRLLIPSNHIINEKLMSPTNKHQIQVTSFEKPSPHTLIGPSGQYDLSTLRRLNSNPYMQTQNLYQNMPFLQRGGLYPQRGMVYYENLALKVPAQTQTSIDGDSHLEDEHILEETALATPSGQHRRRPTKKEKGSISKEPKPLSPTNQRRLKKQSSCTSSEVTEPTRKSIRKKSRRLSIATTTTSDCQEDKNESRSSSSGQDSPKKEQVRRVSLYFNAKKRPSLTSVKTSRSNSLDVNREKDTMVNSERERTNSMSSREIDSMKARKASTSSEKCKQGDQTFEWLTEILNRQRAYSPRGAVSTFEHNYKATAAANGGGRKTSAGRTSTP